MNIFYKLILIPFISFFAMIITVGIIGSFVEYSWMKQHLPSGLPIYLAWLVILTVSITAHYIWKKIKC